MNISKINFNLFVRILANFGQWFIFSLESYLRTSSNIKSSVAKNLATLEFSSFKILNSILQNEWLYINSDNVIFDKVLDRD